MNKNLKEESGLTIDEESAIYVKNKQKSAPHLILQENKFSAKSSSPSRGEETYRNNNRKCAFTLAEVLITLGIIGIVSAMTIPNLINKFEEKKTVSILKETYSMLSQAMIYVVNEHGIVDKWVKSNIQMSDDEFKDTVDTILNYFKPYLRTTKICTAGEPSCIESDDNRIYRLNGTGHSWLNEAHYSSFVLLNGAKLLISVNSGSPIGMSCGRIQSAPCVFFHVKTDNAKKNVFGKNFFEFHVFNDRILPAGYKSTYYYSFPSECQLTTSGRGCTAWVIENGNMDYLHCDDLSWDGKRKCD